MEMVAKKEVYCRDAKVLYIGPGDTSSSYTAHQADIVIHWKDGITKNRFGPVMTASQKPKYDFPWLPPPGSKKGVNPGLEDGWKELRKKSKVVDPETGMIVENFTLSPVSPGGETMKFKAEQKVKIKKEEKHLCYCYKTRNVNAFGCKCGGR